MAKIKYVFAVYIEAEEATDDAGYTPKEIQRLLASTLSFYNAPLNLERRAVSVDYELLESAAIPASVQFQLPDGSLVDISSEIARDRSVVRHHLATGEFVDAFRYEARR